MALSGNQMQQKRGFDWPAIIRTLAVQLVVLLALSGAAIGYVNWSSDTAWSEFVSLNKHGSPDAKIYPRSDIPIGEFRSPAAPHPENLSERAGACRGRVAGRDG